MPRRLDPASLTRWARRSLAQLRGPGGRRYERFRLSPRLRRAEQALLHGWIAALPTELRARLPQLELIPADDIVRISGKILLNAASQARRGDRSTQAVSYVRQHVLVLRRRLFRQRWLGQRLFYHELCHFLWPRLGAGARRGWVVHLRRERAARVRGELGYSAQFRKEHLPGRVGNGGAWRDYVCESFCDTGAYRLARAAGLERRMRSLEFTLPRRHHAARLAAWEQASSKSGIGRSGPRIQSPVR